MPPTTARRGLLPGALHRADAATWAQVIRAAVIRAE